MHSNIDKKLDEVRKKIVISVAKNTMLSNDEVDSSVVFNTILLSWFEDIHTYEDFETKYNAFKSLTSNIKITNLFNIIQMLNGIVAHDEPLIDKAINLYYEIVNDERINDMFLKCGYTIPYYFSSREKYEDLSIKRNVTVFYSFEKELDDIKVNYFDKEKNK